MNQQGELRKREAAELLLADRPLTDHPIITQCTLSSPALPSFAEGSPYLMPENTQLFCSALRDDISLMTIERAKQVFRRREPNEEYPVPESCTPYLDANSLGFYLKPCLPVVFVRTRHGELLLEARVAMKYLRENSRSFRSELETIERHAKRIFREDAYGALRAQNPKLFSDVIQPYSSFTDQHISMRAGLWIQTPPGVSTIIGPPVNQQGTLKVVTGAIETDWHHFELFVVVEVPVFERQVLIIGPEIVIAQLYFAAREQQELAEVRFSRSDPGAEPAYWTAWDQMGRRLVEAGKGLTADRHGIASVQIGCPHCYVSVTAASEQAIPEDHVVRRGFNPLYKILKHAYHSLNRTRE